MELTKLRLQFDEIIGYNNREFNNILWAWIKRNASNISNLVEAEVKPACINCKFLEIKGGLLLKDNTELCQNAKIGLWNLTNCDIDIHKWGCNYFESKSV